MKIIPLFKVRSMRAALLHYTGVLDFSVISGEDTIADLVNGDAELQLTTYESDALFGSVANIWVEDVDALFAKYLSRGLNTSAKPQSPVHQRPTNQTWGSREFYVTDADGNTLRFCQQNA